MESGILAAFLSLLGAQRKDHPTCAPNYAPIYGRMSIISCGHMPIQTPLKVASTLCFMDSIALVWMGKWWSITQSNRSLYPTEMSLKFRFDFLSCAPKYAPTFYSDFRYDSVVCFCTCSESCLIKLRISSAFHTVQRGDNFTDFG